MRINVGQAWQRLRIHQKLSTPGVQGLQVVALLEIERGLSGQSRVSIEPMREALAHKGRTAGSKKTCEFGDKLRLLKRVDGKECTACAFGKTRGRRERNSQHADLIENIFFVTGFARDGLVRRETTPVGGEFGKRVILAAAQRQGFRLGAELRGDQ